ncbi:MAG: hypothetical protein B6D56_04805 [Candidatus Omnitrophica bacterium 4484_70.1]|nr:MAG: hypothetical protein B6D56_04805 [Candidatus Omnitrophica bacterium 4484_70.1]
MIVGMVILFIILIGYIILSHFLWWRSRKKWLERLKEDENQLVQMEKMATLGSLCAGIVHEINNPLTFLIANLSVLPNYITKEDKKTEVPQILEECLEGAQRIKKIVMDVLSLSRHSQGKKELIDVNQILETTLRIAWNKIKYKAVVVKDYKARSKVFVDPIQISQVFLNIIMNGVQAIEDRGTISVSSFEDEEFVYVKISDTGCGIPPNKINKIFVPFYSTKKGIGLGLAIGNNIIKKHGGKIKVESKVGEGTTFTVQLPLSK